MNFGSREANPLHPHITVDVIKKTKPTVLLLLWFDCVSEPLIHHTSHLADDLPF